MNISIVSVLFWLQTSIYNLHFSASDGTDVSFNDFRNKKILIVNSATSSSLNGQFAKLEELYQLYKDSLVIVVFPSNDFGNEPKTDTEIRNYLDSNFHIHYVLASKVSTTGYSIASIYNWLADPALNGVMDNVVPADFCKYLIDGNGNLIGAFTGSVDPMSDDIQNAITNQQ